MVSFLHDAPKVLACHFSKAKLEEVLQQIQLVWVDPAGRVGGVLERRALKLKDLRLRGHVLWNFLRVRIALGDFGIVASKPSGDGDVGVATRLQDLPSHDEINGWVAEARGRMPSRTIRDDAVEKATKPSDSAGVRDVARADGDDGQGAGLCADGDQADECADGGEDGGENEPVELVGEVDIRLDPVGVFCEAEGAGVQLIFDSMIDLVRTEDGGDGAGGAGGGDAEGVVDGAARSVHLDGAAGVGRDGGDAEGGVDGGDAPPPADFVTYNSSREKTALNEFTANANILYGSFWHHFPLAMGLVRMGSLHDGESRHLLTQFHNNFAQDANFTFLLADQKRRHAACRGVSRRIKSNKASYEAFIKKVAAGEQYVQELQEARNDPFSKKVRRRAPFRRASRPAVQRRAGSPPRRASPHHAALH